MVDSPLAARKKSSIENNRRFTILIVEGDEAQSQVLSRRLENLGFNVIMAFDGRQALELARRRTPDLVLTELELADIDGLALSESLADASETCGMPIIMLSGAHRPDIVRQSRAAGCQFYVHKPYDPNALLLLIEHSLNRETADVGGEA